MIPTTQVLNNNDALPTAMIGLHHEAIRSVLQDVACDMLRDDPVVTLIAVTITRDGEIRTFQHGAIEPETALNAEELLRGELFKKCLVMAGKKSPLISAFPVRDAA